METLRPAIFWDRDGTLIEDRGHLASPGEVVFFPDTMDALHRLQDRFLFFIVTNQTGVAEGTINLDDVDRVNAHVIGQLAEAGLTVAAVCVCPHARADKCACIKPNPHFLHLAAQQFNLSLGHSFAVGDHPHDVELAERAGAQGIYVCTGHGRRHLNELHGHEVVVPNIGAVADWILATLQTQGAPPP